jgi:hypothetical protein
MTADQRLLKSSRRRRLTASSHTTVHAGPHTAVHREWHSYTLALDFPSSRAGDAQLSAQLPWASPISFAQ